MKTRFKRLHIETRDGDGSIELDISGEREIHRTYGSSDRANLNAWLKPTVRTYTKCSGAEHSSASSQSKCSTTGAAAAHISGHASAQSREGRREKLDMSEGD
jgi:hypothetical protein